MLRFCAVLYLMLLVACTPAVPATPTALLPIGDVQIITPQTGSILYSPTLYISGTAVNVPASGFILRAISADDAVIAEITIVPDGENWSVELTHTRPTEPTEITLYALPVGDVVGDYDVVSIVLSLEDERPEGTFGMILAPFENDEMGGDVIPVYGTASGLFENTLIVVLEQPDGTLIQEQVITVNNPGIIDEVPWTAEIPTDDYTGAAVIRAYYQDANTGEKITIASVKVMLVFAAG